MGGKLPFIYSRFQATGPLGTRPRSGPGSGIRPVTASIQEHKDCQFAHMEGKNIIYDLNVALCRTKHSLRPDVCFAMIGYKLVELFTFVEP